MCESGPSIINDNLTFYARDRSFRILIEGSRPFVSSLGEAQSAYQLALSIAIHSRRRRNPGRVHRLLLILGQGADLEIRFRFNKDVSDLTFAEHPLPPKIYSDGAIINESLS